MTGSATGEPGRGTDAPTRTTRKRHTASAIVILLALGFALRLIIAYLAPDSGFSVDLTAFRFWAADLARQGPFGFYERDFLHDYTPGYLYVLWLLGHMGGFLGGLGALIKLPAILADLAIAWIVHQMVRELGGGARRALVAAGIVLFNPVTWFDSVVWGQVDSVGVVFLLLGIRELWRGRHERAAVLAVVAAIVKPQLGILVPVVAVVTIGRALFPPSGDGGRARRRPLTIVTTGLAGFLTAVVLSAPFGLSVIEPVAAFPYLDSDLLRQVLSTAAGYPFVTVNAYNPWALAEVGPNSLAATGAWLCDAPGVARCAGTPDVAIGPLPAVVVGAGLFMLIAAIVGWVLAPRPARLTILVGVTVLAIAFFVVPTRVHERYLFPFFALGAILAAVSPRWRVPYAVMSVAMLANMYVVLTTLYSNPTTPDWLGIGQTIRSAPAVTAIALLNLAGFVWALGQLRAPARAALEREVESLPHRRPLHGREQAADAEPDAAPVEAWPQPALGRIRHAARTTRRWATRPSDMDTGLWAAVRRRVLERPIRADRSRALHGEPGGRFDRLDVWLLAVLVVAVLCLRIFRLSEPWQMHFDEIYHARTATEFLQDWRYGEDHAIYEYTHPHLAKYAIAAGLVLFGEDRVTARSDLGAPVRDALVEARWDDRTLPGGRAGDRVYVATGADVRAWDLRTRELVATLDAPGAAILALDATGHELFIGTDTGTILIAETAIALDPLRTTGETDAPLAVDLFAEAGGPVTGLFATDDGGPVLAIVGDDIISFRGDDGVEVGRAVIPGAIEVAGAGTVDVLHADPVAVPDAGAAAATLAELLGGEPADYAGLLGEAVEEVAIRATIDAEGREAVDAAIADGSLAGFSFRAEPRVAVTHARGLAFVAPASGTITSFIGGDPADPSAVGTPMTGLDLVTGLDQPTLYVAAGNEVSLVDVKPDDPGREPFVSGHVTMPGPVARVVYDAATELVHVEGATPDGDGRTIYVIEPHGNSVFADARLPFEPAALAADVAPQHPAADRQELLAFAADGSVAAVEIGRHTFAWRLPGVLAGAVMAGLIYILARILFRRRSVAVLAGILTLVEGMLFVQSRIAMNDAYVGLFIVAAYTLFAAIWTGRWRWRGAFWVAMPLIGAFLGLALAAKWVAAYAIAALGVLILARSALGRLVLVGGLLVGTTVLGYMAVSVPVGATSGGNLFFLLLMIGLTLVAVVASVLHPIAWSGDEVRFAVGAPVAAGGLVALAALATGRMNATFAVGPLALSPLHLGFALAVLGGLVAAGLWAAGRAGFGPLAPLPELDDPVRLVEPPAPSPTGWLNLGSGFGIPAAWIAACLLALPVAIYVASYLPWAMLDGHRITDTWPPGHNGQLLADLTTAMYDYHNNLRATHAASSPWWAWPFDLKPVWFYQGGFSGSTAAAVYDAGNLVIWWLAIPAMAFCAWQAWRRRSLGLALVAIGFAWQWLPWVRIDRATFQYHYYTSLPFVALALGYFLAELWHGASMRTWTLARLAAAGAVVGPALLWLGKGALCGYARVEAVNPGSQACVGNPGNLVVTGRVAGVVVVVGAAIVVLLWQLARLDRSDVSGRTAPGRRLAGMALIALAAFVALAAINGLVPDIPVISIPGFRTELVALLLLVPLALVASFVVTARDARRFVVGVATAAVAAFAIWYPNLAALPLPSTIVNAYQGVLPTYLYPFQFPVNTDPVGAAPSLIAPEPAILLVALTVTAGVLAYSAWVWRIALAERAAVATDGADAGADAGPGGEGSTPGGFARSGGEA